MGKHIVFYLAANACRFTRPKIIFSSMLITCPGHHLLTKKIKYAIGRIY